MGNAATVAQGVAVAVSKHSEDDIRDAFAGLSEDARKRLEEGLGETSSGASASAPAPDKAPAKPAAEQAAGAGGEGLPEAALREAFQAIDDNKSGAIELHELSRVMKALQFELTEDELLAVFQSMDINGNGKIEYDEYMTMAGLAFAS
eukprot:TRINITY_DN111548_c0_g1_i1.p1 TRINITY_DN111548_c0_g1~~TRINITY_DN111548_c0_g1_i1.p1  ORF type:complete len:148 (+),score=39.20 TRINITY_DN111548_c0_g1_i1:158-601(+)